jgi:hypothetical protein
MLSSNCELRENRRLKSHNLLHDANEVFRCLLHVRAVCTNTAAVHAVKRPQLNSVAVPSVVLFVQTAAVHAVKRPQQNSVAVPSVHCDHGHSTSAFFDAQS